jgi:septum formation protein
MNKDRYQIILASASPRRAELLQQIAISAKVFAVDIDETQKQGEAALDYVQRLAIEKAQRGYTLIGESDDDHEQSLPVLGSDTIVEIDGLILGKPENREHAKEILQHLSAKQHFVHTSVAIVVEDKQLCLTSSSEVFFETLEEDVIDRYVATGEADDKAGAYGIQGLAGQFVERINGSYSGVMGLPLFETAKLLKQCGVTSF